MSRKKQHLERVSRVVFVMRESDAVLFDQNNIVISACYIEFVASFRARLLMACGLRTMRLRKRMTPLGRAVSCALVLHAWNGLGGSKQKDERPLESA